MKVCIVIPAHNEENRIAPTLEEYSKFFSKLEKREKIDFEILVVINNSTDRTLEIAADYSRNYENVSYLNFKRGGKGFAVVEGFKDAIERGYDFVGFVDADMATQPEEYWKVVKGALNSDGAIADRSDPLSKVYPSLTFRRAVVSRIYNLFVRTLFLLPYGDTQCGAKVFRASALKQVVPHIGMTKWAFDVELLYLLRKSNFEIVTVPTIWVDKEYSKINFAKAGPLMLLGIIRLRILHSFLRKFIRLYDTFVNIIR